MRAALKRILSELLGKGGTPVVAVFVADGGEASQRMVKLVRETTPGIPLILVAPPGVDRSCFSAEAEWIAADGAIPYGTIRRALARRWVGLAPVLVEGEGRWRRLWWALLTAPRRVVAFHANGESHPLRLRWPIASWRFLKGEPLGDLFRPTAFWWVGDVGRRVTALVLLGGWLFARIRATRTSAEATPPADEGSTVFYAENNDFGADLDKLVRSARVAEIILSTGARDLSEETISGLRGYLRRPGIWMVAGSAPCRYPFADSGIHTRAHESWTYCLGAPSSLLAFRRDVYLQVCGAAAGEGNRAGERVAAMCLLALVRGWKTVYAGEIGDPIDGPRGPRQEIGVSATRTAELLVAGVDSARPALEILDQHAGNADFQRHFWRAVRNIRPVRATGKRSGKLLPLVQPGAVSRTGRQAGRRPRVAVLTPYFPYPLSHGGAIRIYNLLRHMAADFDLHLFAFAESETDADIDAMREHCVRVVLVKPPVWEAPRWLTATPRGVRRYRVEQMRCYVEEFVKDFDLSLIQVEFTQLAFFGKWLRTAVPKVLVEHDVTFDLHRQAADAAEGWRRAAARTESWRWRSFELSAIGDFERVITMSSHDSGLLETSGVAAWKLAVVENGIDLERFQAAEADAPEPWLLFVGSFRHFPNVRAYRLLVEEIWARIKARRPDAKLTVVAGPDPKLYWRKHLGAGMPPPPDGVDLREFVADVRPLYQASQVVAVPVPLSAGTNIKVLEALAMGRPVVSTAVGCAGLDLEDGRTVLIADDADSFASAVLRLFADDALRRRLSNAGRRHVERQFGWPALALKQGRIWEELLRNRDLARP